MQKSLWTTILMLGISPFLIQCVAATGQSGNAALRLRTLETRVTTIEKSTDSLSAQNKGQAEMGLTVDSIEAQMMQIKGNLEENNRQLREIKKDNREGLATLDHQIDTRIQENNTKIQAQLEERLADQQKNMAKLADLLNTALQEIDTIKQVRARQASDKAIAAAQAAKQAAKQAEQARKQKAQPATATLALQKPAKATGLREISPAQTKKTMSSKEMQNAAANAPKKEGSGYEKGLTLYRAQKYKEAYNTLLDYIEKEPKGKMVANARFWLGDSLFKQREYELAILEYQKVIADYPKHDKAPAALLKQGLAFERLKDMETAKLVYKKLLEDFPNSDQAVTAKNWLKKH